MKKTSLAGLLNASGQVERKSPMGWWPHTAVHGPMTQLKAWQVQNNAQSPEGLGKQAQRLDEAASVFQHGE